MPGRDADPDALEHLGKTTTRAKRGGGFGRRPHRLDQAAVGSAPLNPEGGHAMRRARTRTSGRTTKLVLILLGLVSFSGAIALAERSGLSFSPVAKGQGGGPSNPTRALSIRVTPAVRTVAPGDVAKFRIRIRRHSPTAGDAGPEGMQRHKRRIVRLGTLGGLPRGRPPPSGRRERAVRSRRSSSRPRESRGASTESAFMSATAGRLRITAPATRSGWRI